MGICNHSILALIYPSDPTKVLENVTVPIPTPASTQVLLKVHAVALNPAGYKSIHHFPSFIVKKPCIPEFDVSGTVVGVGPSVKTWKVGDEVFGILNTFEVFKTGMGGLAEYTLAREELLYLTERTFLMQGIENRPF